MFRQSTSILDRRGFLRHSFAGSAGLALAGTPMWAEAAQLLDTPPIRTNKGIGLDDPELVELSINENPLGASRRAIEEVAKRMFGMNRYPFHDQLEQALGKHHDVSPEMILTGVGSTEILNLLTLAAFYEREGNTVTGFPSYPEIPRKTEGLGRQVKKVKLKADWSLDPAELRRFIESVPKDVVVCVDEAYIHFVDDPTYLSMIPATKELDNLLVTRTFSKAYGLGGVRVGYGVANPELLQRLGRFGMGVLNKNTLSIAAALGALDDPEHVRQTVQVAREGKDFLYARLEEMGYHPIRTQTIFVTVEIGSDVETLIEMLREQKINVRQAFDMEGYMRVSVGLPRENEAFADELQKLASGR